MSQFLHGLHDPGGEHLMLEAGKPGWIVHTVSLKTQGPTDYRVWSGRGLTNIVRLNYGYGADGTIPHPDKYAEFAELCAAYVEHSPGCNRWIIGNEPNHEQERPGGRPISPQDYAVCYRLCRMAIKAVQPDAEVITAAIAPWNIQTGDWLTYFEKMLMLIGAGNLDGIALHTYTHGADSKLIASTARMDAPYTSRFWHFRAYQDFLRGVPTNMRRLPVYITETNQGDDGWVDACSGWVQNAYAEIDAWNRMGATQKIRCLCLYRWPRYDRWHIDGKTGVQQDFRLAVARGYASPVVVQAQSSVRNEVYMPIIRRPQSNLTTQPEPKLEWDKRLDYRGVRLERADAQPGQTCWRVVKAQWLDEQQSQGRHHIYVDALDENGNRVVGVSFVVTWPDGAHRITTEAKPGEPYAANYPMSKSLNEYGVVAVDGKPSDRVVGIGMGNVDSPELGTQRNPAVHTSTFIVFQAIQERKAVQPTTPSQNAPSGLAHPVADARYRTITQRFGERPGFYGQFSVDGVRLRGHNGVDFATPEGTQVVAVDEGRVVEAYDDPDGYGKYIKLSHAWGESLYAHLSERYVVVGNSVDKGQPIGESGNTGNSTGPHLHFGMRVAPFNRADGWGGFTDPLPFLPRYEVEVHPMIDVWPLIQEVATEFGVDRYLLASLIWGESSFRPNALSEAGAEGLGQITTMVWEDWAKQVGATDPFNARDNLRVAAAYLRWLLTVLKYDAFKAIVAYNFGIGNVMQDVTPPLETVIFAHKVIHGRDLLRAVIER